VAATTGHKVTLVEIDGQLIDKAQKSIEKSLERVAKKQFKDEEAKIKDFVQDSMSRINGSTDLSTVVKDTDIVIEAIVENLEIKQKLFASIDGVSSKCKSNYFCLINIHILDCKAIDYFC
jgi:3-hydroxyacyl-CoA dehydrogenase